MIATPPHRAWSATAAELGQRGQSIDLQVSDSDGHHDDRVDTELMSLFRDSGRREVFDALYQHSRGRVFAWLRWVLREQQARLDPVDLLQDTFVNVYRYASSFRSEHDSSYRSWIRTIAANVVRRARANNIGRAVAEPEPRWSEPVDSHAGPQRRVSEGEECLHLRTAWLLFLQHYAGAFERLSPRDRRALELVEVEGLSYAETSTRLGVGPSNMKMIMLRARRRLVGHMSAAMCGSRPSQAASPQRARRLSA